MDLTEDYSPGDSLSDSFEELLWSGKGGTMKHMRGFAGKKNVVRCQKITYCYSKTADISS